MRIIRAMRQGWHKKWALTEVTEENINLMPIIQTSDFATSGPSGVVSALSPLKEDGEIELPIIALPRATIFDTPKEAFEFAQAQVQAHIDAANQTMEFIKVLKQDFVTSWDEMVSDRQQVANTARNQSTVVIGQANESRARILQLSSTYGKPPDLEDEES